MKITCDREKLLAAFQTASSVTPSRSPKPILQNIKLDVSKDAAVLMATDLQVGIRIEVPGVEVVTPGSAVLPKIRFGSILQENSDEKLNLEADGQNTIVRGSYSEFKLSAENPDEFPATATFAEENYHELPARLLREMIRRTIFATDNESSRYALGGILIELEDKKITAVATDGRRLAKMEGPALTVGTPATGENTTIIPSKAMQLVERALSDADAEIQLAVKPNTVLIKSQRVTISTGLVEGRFPKWRDVFPRWSDVAKIELTVGPLLSAVRQAAIVTSEESRGVDFTFGDGRLVLAGQTAEVGQSRVEVPIAYDAAPFTLKLDPRYVSDFLRVLSADKTFQVEVKDAESAALFSTDDGYACVVMPLARER